jgi:hypothetical protein
MPQTRSGDATIVIDVEGTVMEDTAEALASACREEVAHGP